MFNKIKFAKILNNINDKYDTMTEFAKSSGVNRTYLSQYINQKLDAPPSPKVLMRIANSSQNITTYEELMETCGFLIKDVNKNLDEIRDAENTLKYENMIKKLSLSEKEESIVNKINNSFDEFNKNNSITDSEKKSLKILKDLDTSSCDISKIKQAAKTYIVSRCAKAVIDSIYDKTSKIDHHYNYIESFKKLKSLSPDIELDKQNSRYYMCPVYGRISAGQPNWAEECIEGRIPIDPDMMNIANPEECFFLKVNGESMNKVVKNGAFALIKKTDFVKNGEIAVVLVNGFDATLKKFSKQEDLIILEPMSDDSSITTQVYNKDTEIKVIGKYIGKMEFNN